MKTLIIILIIICGLILLGPIMLLVAKLNKIDPYIIFKSKEEVLANSRSYVMVNILKPLFFPLWGESWLFSKKYRKMIK